MIELYVRFIYQPFFNLLVGIYYGLNQIPHNPYADMGIALVIFTIALRLILLPMTFASNRSEKERREIEDTIKKIKHDYQSDPIKQKQLIRRLWVSNRRVVVAETINFIIQTIVFFMLYRIFSKGLLGADLHLLYKFMPDIPQPFDLTLFGKYDLTHPNITLNIVQSIVIFVAELLSMLTSPFPITQDEVIRLQLILPLAAFLIFMTLPAGKKVFIITTLLFSIVYILLQVIRRFFTKHLGPPPASHPVAVEG